MASIFASIRVTGQSYRDTDQWWRYARILFAYYASGQLEIRVDTRRFASLCVTDVSRARSFTRFCVKVRQNMMRIRGCLRRSASWRSLTSILRWAGGGAGLNSTSFWEEDASVRQNASRWGKTRRGTDQRNRRVHLNERESDLNSSCRDGGRSENRGRGQ